MGKTIEIPEGYEARIEGSKVILERKESEDERIRQAIESIIRVYGKTQGEWIAGYDMDTLVVHLRDAFAYLKKQKEQKPAKDTALQEAFINSKIDYTLEEKCDASDYAEIILPTSVIYGENEEEYKLHKIIEAAFIAGQKKEQQPALRLVGDGLISDPNAHFEVVSVQKPTEKQDYSGLTDLERAIHRGFLCAGVENVPVGIIKDTAQDCLAQIKPAEWSDVEKMHLANAILAAGKEWGVDSYTVKFLESLRPSWKPSEEQMRAVFDASERNDKLGSVLSTLYNDLKKL